MKKQLLFTFLFLIITKLTFATFSSGNWRWRNDDGNETTATWRAAENTAIQVNTQNEVLRLRTEIGVPLDINNNGMTYSFSYQYSVDGINFTALTKTSGSNAFVIAASNPNVINGTATTKQLNGYSSFSNYTFTAGTVIVNNDFGNYTISSTENRKYEHELVFLPTQNMEPGKTYYFQLAGFTPGGNSVLASFTTASTLPISLKSLLAKSTASGMSISWKTTSELNNKYFDLQRSTDGIKWATIAKIDGNGTTNQENNYNYIDKNAASGINYYRLIQFDFDGKSITSGVASAKFELESDLISVYPNPFIDNLVINLKGYDGKVFDVALYNINGKVVLAKKVTALNSQLQFNLEQTQPNGIYMLKISGNGLNLTQKVTAK
ncbi:T9SS type A sorting domain-containing protein [Pedobacter alpinus]|uniref:T9SS type A sorting domain-containing protein n=1 Tax=Pedobacter alpinus TaxID=1590643 RepID=A0ABW5TUK1_9SPHI